MNRINRYIQDSLQSIYNPQELKSIKMALCLELLGLNQMDLYMPKQIKLTRSKWQKFTKAVDRLAKHEPLQYVVGSTYFYGSKFSVKPGVLIPRPETEELVDLILRENEGAYSLLDIGTGSGCIALSIAKNNVDARVEAWDISDDALKIARSNGKQLGVHVRFKKQDILSYQPKSKRVDIIVSNPPYITHQEQTLMTENVLSWEPHLALFVEDHNPLLFYNRIAEVGLVLLKCGGRLYFEINQAYGQEMFQLLEQKGYKNVQVLKDVFGNDRIVTAER